MDAVYCEQCWIDAQNHSCDFPDECYCTAHDKPLRRQTPTDERMVVEVRDVLDAVPGSMLFGAGLFLNGSRLPVTVLSHVADNVDGSVWLADGWSERITPQ